MEHRFINRNELRVIGMSRSGNHAIIHWIMSQAPGRICFLNCAEGKNNPYQTARVMDDGRVYLANDPQFDLDRERAGDFSCKDYLIFSHEDGWLGRAVSAEYERRHDLWVGPSMNRFDLLILRDPFNLFASRIRCLWGFVTMKTAVRIWKQHAREFLGETRRLRHQPVPISYNRWRADRRYRRKIADTLGLNFTDEGINDVVACNGGSSFDGTDYDGRPAEMKVLERWKHYAADPAYRAIFDDELLELSQRIFGHIPGTDALLPAVAQDSPSLLRAG